MKRKVESIYLKKRFFSYEISRDFFFRVCYALLKPAQRVDHGRNTRGPREEYAWSTGGIRLEYAWNTRGIRVDHGRNTRGPREEYAWNTRFKQTVINDVFNKRFKRFNFVIEI
jgi:hypothetical protein